ncbi:MAG: PAS domain-containing protein [Desulfobacterales bacterium]|nr:PAS domain-containing protein [Desulfobacterales bacterium]
MTIIVFVLAGIGGWLLYECHRLRMRLARMSRTAQGKRNEYERLENDHLGEVEARRLTEDKLRRYLRLMDAIINAIPNPVYFRDGEDVFQGCNNAFARDIMGLTRDRILGKRPRDLADQIPEELIACLEGKIQRTPSGNGLLTFEKEVPCADGIRREFLFSISLLSEDQGQTDGTVGVMLDLTQKNRAARERAQREKFQGVLETAGGVCHEMNQPLQVISGYTEIMMSEMPPAHKMFRMARLISDQVDRMADITSKLQKITHYETMDYGEHARIIDIHKSSRSD